MTALASLYPDEAARAVRAEAALPGTYAEVAARSSLTEEQAMAALHVLRGAGRVVLDRGVYSKATPEQLLLAGLGRGTPELRARVLAELPGNAVQRYVGVSGFMSRAEVDAALAALPAGLTLMAGVLASAKGTFGAGNKYPLRYPKAADISGIFSPDARCLNLLHWSSGETPDEALVEMLRTVAGPHCHGFQFNGAWPLTSTLAGLSGGHVVLQYRPGKSSLDLLRASVAACRNVQAHVLIDGSGGRGEALDGDQTEAIVGVLRYRFGPSVGIGIAGGLCAEALPSIARLVRLGHLSIDAEGRLRDGDHGGTLNLDKVRAYLAAAGVAMGAS